MNTTENTVDIFLREYYPRAIDAFISFIDELQACGQVNTLDDLRAELVRITQEHREMIHIQNGEMN